jgi:hypothetical protein
MKNLVRIIVLAVGIGTGYYQLQRSVANNLTTKGGTNIWMEATVATSLTCP